MRKNWMSSNGMIEVDFDELVKQTDSAILIRIDKEEYWLPKSQIDFREWSKIVEVPVWLAEQKGLY